MVKKSEMSDKYPKSSVSIHDPVHIVLPFACKDKLCIVLDFFGYLVKLSRKFDYMLYILRCQ